MWPGSFPEARPQCPQAQASVSSLQPLPWGRPGNSQWLRLCAPTATDRGSIPGQGTKIPTCLMAGKKEKRNRLEAQLPVSR